MRGTRTLAALIAATAFLTAAAGPVKGSTDTRLERLEALKSSAFDYEADGNNALAYEKLVRYADLAQKLANDGLLSQSEADIAEGWRNSLEFAPEFAVEDASSDGVYFGSDGIFIDGASALKVDVPYGYGYVEDIFPSIPSVKHELCIYVTLDVTNEKTLRNVTLGKDDEYLIKNLRQLSRIEGKVYFAFCPNPNTMKYTRTVEWSFIYAYRHVAGLARRYAPNVKMVYSVADVVYPGRDTVAAFYPGDTFVDVLGVELCHTYRGSYMPSPEAAYDIRGEYYDPLLSVKRISDELGEVSDKHGMGLIVTCSFPWSGYAARSDWAEQMERFYRLLPAACPDLIAVLYSNVSSSNGICNLRENEQALAIYKNALTLPWYICGKDDAEYSFAPLDTLSSVALGKPLNTELFCGGKYKSLTDYTVYVDSKKVPSDGLVFEAGEYSVQVYITDEDCPAVIEYIAEIDRSGDCTIQKLPAKYDYNGNGILDFGDAEYLIAYIRQLDINLGSEDTDVNGDGKLSVTDISALYSMMSPE